MDLFDVYDKYGQDGIDNAKEFDLLPGVMQYFVASQQKLLVQKVINKVREEYGEEGIRSLRKTSGFRAFCTNKRCGGVSNSLHLFGLAVDFAKDGIFKDKPIPVCCNLQCIVEGNHYHIQFKRGK